MTARRGRRLPDPVIADLRDLDDPRDVAALQVALADRLDWDTCRWCQRPIARVKGGQWWQHIDRDHSRGCRAATFVPDEGWDDRFTDRTKRAEPVRRP
jgi:hypothetical protein